MAQTTTQPGRDASPHVIDYEDERARFSIDALPRFHTVATIHERWAAEDPVDELSKPVSGKIRRVELRDGRVPRRGGAVL